MRKFLALIKVLLKNSGSTLSGMNTKRRNLSFFILALIFIPIVVGLTAVFMKSYDVILKYNLKDLIFSQLFGASSIAMIILGIFYVVSTYYFADDVVCFITMPIKPYKVLGAKFVMAMIYQYFIELILLLPCIIGFGIKMGTPLYWAYSLVIYIVLPVIPTVICSLISIVIMAFSKFFRNKDRMKIIAGVLAIVFSISLSVVIQYFSGYSGNSANIFKNGKVVGKVSNAFFISKFASDSINNINSGKGLLDVLVFILIFAVFMFAEKTMKAKVVISQNKAYIKSGMESTKFNLKDVTRVYIKNTIPHSSKVMGFNWGSEKRGKFNVDGMGKGNIYVQSDSGKFLYIKLKNGFVIINYKDSNKTEEIYKKIKNCIIKEEFLWSNLLL